MFKKQFLFYFSLWLLLAFSFTKVLKFSNPSAKQEYLQLMEDSSAGKEKKSNYKAQQNRFNISKHIFFTKENERLQMYLKSPRSDLYFEQENGKTELVEHFKDVFCLIQEEFLDSNEVLDGSQQIIRQIEAVTASYHYQSENFLAEQVKLFRYISKGNTLKKPFVILTPLMSGEAKSLQLSLSSPNKSFKAQELKAVIQNWGAP